MPRLDMHKGIGKPCVGILQYHEFDSRVENILKHVKEAGWYYKILNDSKIYFGNEDYTFYLEIKE